MPAEAVRAARLETFRTSFSRKDQLETKLSQARIAGRKVEVNALERLLRLDYSAETLAGEKVLQEQLADDPRAHYYRRAVALALEPNWSTRAHALLTCGEAGARCDCADCGTPHVLPYRCGARSCPTCARQASGIACEKVARKAELAEELQLLGPWDGAGEEKSKRWYKIELTTKAPKTLEERYDAWALGTAVVHVRKAWGPFWRSTAWGRRNNYHRCDADGVVTGRRSKRVRRDTLAAMGLEIGDGGMVHIHFAVYGERIEESTLLALWKKACPIGGFIRMRVIRDRKTREPITAADQESLRTALREVLKYLTKGHKTDLVTGQLAERGRRAAAAEYAMKNQRRVETCGALRLVPTITDKDVATHGKSCSSCREVPSAWQWRGLRAPDYVRRNGGFGLAQIADDEDAEQLRIEDRSYRMEVQHRARKLAAENAHHYRAGGMYYGGDAPPWWDDPDEWTSEEVARRGDEASDPDAQSLHELHDGIFRALEE